MARDLVIEYYLVFYVGDGSDRESASCYYSNIILASSVKDACEQLMEERNTDDDSVKNYDAIKCSDTIMDSKKYKKLGTNGKSV